MRNPQSIPAETSDRPRRHRYHRACKWSDGARLRRDSRQMDFWQRRVMQLEATGRLTPDRAAAIRTLRVFFNRGTGRCDPSHESIATLTGLSVKTVQRALADARTWRLIDWDQRATWRDGEGTQITNQYRLLPGMAAAQDAPAIEAPASKPGHTESIKINPLGSSDSVSPLDRALASLGAAIKAAGR
jgi:hypothetical protein